MPKPPNSVCLPGIRFGQAHLSVFAGLFLLAGCGSGGETESPSPPAEEITPSTEELQESEPPAPTDTEELAVPASPEVNSSEVSQRLLDYLGSFDDAERTKSNPLSGKADAIKKGKEEYLSVCMPCHGESGKGDGPAAAVMGIVPADLTSSLRSKAISAGDRFLIMKNGIPGTTMQAFGAALSDAQIWTLLAYAETLVVSDDAKSEPSPQKPTAPE